MQLDLCLSDLSADIQHRANSRRVFWKIDRARFRVFLPHDSNISLLQTWFYSESAEIAGYMQARAVSPRESLHRYGWMFMISERAPILVAFSSDCTLPASEEISWPGQATALLALFCRANVFGGLRGSRSETVLLLFWVVGCILLVRHVPRTLIYCWLSLSDGIPVRVWLLQSGTPFMRDCEPTEAFFGSEQPRKPTGAKERVGHQKGQCLGPWQGEYAAFILYRLTEDGR